MTHERTGNKLSKFARIVALQKRFSHSLPQSIADTSISQQWIDELTEINDSLIT